MSPQSETTSSPENNNPNSEDDKFSKAWGYDLYPERRGTFTPSAGKVLAGIEGRENIDKFKCEKNVYKCIKDSEYKTF